MDDTLLRWSFGEAVFKDNAPDGCGTQPSDFFTELCCHLHYDTVGPPYYASFGATAYHYNVTNLHLIMLHELDHQNP